MRNSALASAALTSVALLAQTANAAPSAADEAPSREEVSRRVSSLYDQAEADTGTFNATRAASTGPRARADRPTDTARRPATAPRDNDSRRSDPALDSVARQWFDAARANMGPIVAAVLPTDRVPDHLAGTRPARPANGPDRAQEPSGRTALELPAAPVAELTSGGATRTAAVAELTAGPVAALPAASEAPQETTASRALALPGPAAEPTAEPQERSALRTSKEQSQRKLDRARALLSEYSARQSAPLAAIEAVPVTGTWGATPTPVQHSADAQWQALQAQGPDDLTTVPAGTTAWATTPDPLTDPLPAVTTSQAVATGQTATTSPATTAATPALDTNPFPGPSDALTSPDPLTDPLPAVTTSQTVATSQTATTSPATTAATPALDTNPSPALSGAFTSPDPQDTRALRALDFARAQIGKPCVWGTTGPEAYDGAGLTQAAWKAAGIALPRTAPEQATAGRGIAVTYAEPGDLVLFHVGHVGICSGNGTMIHAPGPGAAIREESIYYAGESAIHSVIRPA
ncbi:NlpC/P60 family protein [Streptomyces sp. NPDC012935]|uniref:C40 family peptidase n=1 Tax=Streptomyces sp. NPDC012935 TaxID=3364857 RepID=UPI0036CCF435